MSFAAGKYARYKRATAFFLDWLLRARGRGRHTAQRVQLEAFNEVVKEIAADPSCLTPKLLQELPKALAACRYAILLREHVAAFFPEDHEGQIIVRPANNGLARAKWWKLIDCLISAAHRTESPLSVFAHRKRGHVCDVKISSIRSPLQCACAGGISRTHSVFRQSVRSV
ncbi:hypothetical protein PF010_g16421 [Phytophthora fragariae]|uniref:Uncharacterized protein n=1 Tax=Phytophthora fragariae TaxID=53985 RepID=A0A6G0KRP2_9STRA|nr:hypothetical protein PF010_g16421 [Phytophthora fragariae]